MSSSDVPGANPANNDKLAMGCWAEHSDGSLILVESVEQDPAGKDRVVYSIFDVGQDPPVEYRGAMPLVGFEKQFSYKADRGAKVDDDILWTWHDKTPFDWDRVMGDFTEGQRYASAVALQTVAQRVAKSLDLRASEVRARVGATAQPIATNVMSRIKRALDALFD